jgi:hypothetical protein
MVDDRSESGVPENSSRLVIIDYDGHEINVSDVVRSLRQDLLVLIRNIASEQADRIMHDVAAGFGLSDALELQVGFAGFMGHRHNVGKYFMSVNERGDYQFISPHSEGDSFVNFQLASFFCYENSTDGGETILMNVNDSSIAWQSFREKVRRGRLGKRLLAPHEIRRARGLYRLSLPEDALREDDQILKEHQTDIADLTILDVLAKPRRAYSRILERELYVYWDSIASIDFDSASEYLRMLRQCGLLREPQGGLELREMDNAAHRRVRHSGVDYAQLFNCKITRKLVPGDLIIQNNLTWTHAVANWSPGSGTRSIAACFA